MLFLPPPTKRNNEMKEKRTKTDPFINVPPNDPELEKEIIGCLILFPTELAQSKNTLGEIGNEAFYSSKLRLVYKALLKMEEQEIPIAIETVSPFIKEKFKEEIPGNFLVDLVNKAIGEELLKYQLKKLKELYFKRKLQSISIRSFQAVNNEASVEEIKQELMDSLAEIKITEEKRKPITAKELLEKKLPKYPYFIGKGLLPKQGYTMIVGKAKEGKTMLALYFALCLAEGCPVFMRESDKTGVFPVPHKAKTLFLFRENSETMLKAIITKQRKGVEMLLNRKIKDKTLSSIKLLRPRTLYLDIVKGQRELEQVIKNNPVDLVVIDPLSRFITKEMNRMEVVVEIANFLDNLNEKYGCAFLLLHHFRKLAAGEKEAPDPFERITGSAGWRNCLVSCIAMEKKSERKSRNIKKLSFEFRYEESLDPITIIRDSNTLIFKPITEEEVLEGASSVSQLVEIIQKEFKNGVRYSVISSVASERFGVTKQRIAELLKKGIEEGLIGKEKGKTGKYFVLSQKKFPYDT